MNCLSLLILMARPAGMPSVDQVLKMDEKLRLSESVKIMALDTVPPVLPYDILHYAIDIEIDNVGDSIQSARTDVVFQIIDDTTTTLFLDFVDSSSSHPSIGLTVDSVLLDGAAASWSMVGSDTARDLAVNLGSVNPGQVDTVSVFYHGIPVHPYGIISDGGLNINDTMCYVDDEPWGARHWFPCVDIPSEKATSWINVRVPAGWRAVANGVLVDSSLSGSKWSFTWDNSAHQIATYLIVFAAYDFATLYDTFAFGGDTCPIFHYVAHSDSGIAETEFQYMPEMLGIYSQRYSLYPFMDQKYSQIQVKDLGGAMENQTNTFFGFDIDGSAGTSWVQAHELSHHWWGDALTCGTWPDIWLNEGFATFSEAVWWEGHAGQEFYQYWIDSVRMYIYLRYHHDPPIPIYNPGQALDELFSVEVYDKGGCVLHSLRKITEYLLDGDTLAFWGALRYYFDNHKESYATTSDFTTEYQAYTGLDLDWFFDQWLYKAGHPVYDVHWQPDSLGPNNWRVDISMDQVQDHSYNVPVFKMPIPLKFSTTSGDTTVIVWDSLSSQSFTLYLNSKPTDMQFDPENWVIDSHTVVVGVEEQASRPRTRVLSFGPNPMGDNLKLVFLAPVGSEAELSVFSVDGRLVARKGIISQDGPNTIDLNTRDMSSGTFIIRLRLNQKTIFKTKVVKP